MDQVRSSPRESRWCLIRTNIQTKADNWTKAKLNLNNQGTRARWRTREQIKATKTTRLGQTTMHQREQEKKPENKRTVLNWWDKGSKTKHKTAECQNKTGREKAGKQECKLDTTWGAKQKRLHRERESNLNLNLKQLGTLLRIRNTWNIIQNDHKGK